MTLDSLQMQDTGSGAAALVLHGGAGAESVAPIASHLAETMRVLYPTHPGWGGTPRPAELNTMADLAALYAGVLEEQDLRDVAVIGSSIGGWIGIEMALADADDRIGRLVLVDPVGAAVGDEGAEDVSTLTPHELAAVAFHDPAVAGDPADLTPEQVQTRKDDIAALLHYAGGPGMEDPALGARLGEVDVPTLAIWGESDGIVTPAYGRAMAGAIPGARFEVIAEAGHLPQLERPAETFRLIDDFLAGD